jgi:hypothetical protein
MRMCYTIAGLYHMTKKAKYSPRGVESKVIALRLMPEERKEACELSDSNGLSCSAFARKVYLTGLPLVRKELASTKAS